MSETPLVIDREVRAVTTASIWLIRPSTYCRLPRHESPRGAPGPDMEDAVWHGHDGAWLLVWGDVTKVRLMPASRHGVGGGIMTGDVEEMTGS